MRFYLLLLVALVAGGCAATQTTADHAAPQKAMAAEVNVEQIQPVDVQGDNYFVYEHAGRIYVLGQEKTSRFFAEHKHIPYARTRIGEGPRGETLVIEIDKKQPELTERLIETFATRPYPIDQAENYFVFAHKDRSYVLGSEVSAGKFLQHGHIPYARTQIGAGPFGETVVYEIDKKNPELTDRLVQTFSKRPFPVIQDNGLFVYKHLDRFYVLGSEKSAEKFVAHGHIPYARTLIGAGPNGESIVYEIDKKDPKLADRLEASFRG